MKRYFLLVVLGVAVLLPQAVQPPRPLAEIVPAGPLVYVEAKDFAALLKDWTGSSEKRIWTGGDNYKVFAQSRLFLRLADAQQEFAATAGFAPDMTLADAVAGTNSALALYDIGNLEFLYVTRMPSARAYQTILWQSRAKFQPRKAAGIDYFVRQEQRRLAAFAVTNDLLLIATEEQAMASALALLAGQSRPAMTQEPWYQHATAAQPAPGEVRMVLNFERVARTPYFRSYWLQRNTSDLKQFNAVISDLDRAPAEYREQRTLLRAEPAADTRSAESAVSEISRFALPDAGLVRAWAKPDASVAVDLIGQKIIAPHFEGVAEHRQAPDAGNVDATFGTEEDLETRIDEPPVVDNTAALDHAPLRTYLEANPAQAMLQVETSRPAADGVFVSTPRAIALAGSKPWDANAARTLLESVVSKQWTVTGPLSNLARPWVAASGRVLIIASSEDLLTAMSGRASAQPVLPGAQYAMRYLHARELPNFQRMMTLIDHPALKDAGDQREPLFFSENILSLGRTLSRIDSVSLESHDDGGAVRQKVVYRVK